MSEPLSDRPTFAAPHTAGAPSGSTGGARGDGKQHGLTAGQDLRPEMITVTLLRRGQLLRLTPSRRHPPEPRRGIGRREDDDAVRPPACTTQIPRQVTDGRGRATLHRNTLQHCSGAPVIESHRRTVGREEGAVQSPLGHERLGGQLVQRAHMELLGPSPNAPREIGNAPAIG